MAEFHYLHFRAYAHATEDPAKVRGALWYAMGAEPEVEEEAVEGHHGNPVTIYSAELKRAAEVRAFFKRLAKEPRVAPRLLEEIEQRTDEGCNFYLRLGKQEAAEERLALATDDDVIQVRGKVAAYPAKRHLAVEKLRTLLEGLADEE